MAAAGVSSASFSWNSSTFCYLVTGCNGIVLPNYDLDIYDFAGGTLLDSPTTDANGYLITTVTGSVFIKSHDGRFSGDTFTLPGSSIALTSTGDYHCVPCCSLPVYKTIYVTDPKGGTGAAGWLSGSTWVVPCTMQAGASWNCQACTQTGSGFPMNKTVAFLGSCKTVIEVAVPACGFCTDPGPPAHLATPAGTDISGGPLGCSNFSAAGAACTASVTVNTNCTPPFNASGGNTGCHNWIAAGGTLAVSE